MDLKTWKTYHLCDHLYMSNVVLVPVVAVDVCLLLGSNILVHIFTVFIIILLLNCIYIFSEIYIVKL